METESPRTIILYFTSRWILVDFSFKKSLLVKLIIISVRLHFIPEHHKWVIKVNKIISQLFLRPNIVTDRTAAFGNSLTLSGISADVYSECMRHRDESLFRAYSTQSWGEAQHCWRCKSGAFRPLICQLLAGTPLTADSLANTESHLWWMAKYMTGFLPRLPRGLHADSKADPPQRQPGREGGKQKEDLRQCSYVHACASNTTHSENLSFVAHILRFLSVPRHKAHIPPSHPSVTQHPTDETVSSHLSSRFISLSPPSWFLLTGSHTQTAPLKHGPEGPTFYSWKARTPQGFAEEDVNNKSRGETNKIRSQTQLLCLHLTPLVSSSRRP